jgi:hypothetical protein
VPVCASGDPDSHVVAADWQYKHGITRGFSVALETQQHIHTDAYRITGAVLLYRHIKGGGSEEAFK